MLAWLCRWGGWGSFFVWVEHVKLGPDRVDAYDFFGDATGAVVDRDGVSDFDTQVEHVGHACFSRFPIDDDFEDVLVVHFDFEVSGDVVLVVPVCDSLGVGWDDSFACDLGACFGGWAVVRVSFVEEPGERQEHQVSDEAPDECGNAYHEEIVDEFTHLMSPCCWLRTTSWV